MLLKWKGGKSQQYKLLATLLQKMFNSRLKNL